LELEQSHGKSRKDGCESEHERRTEKEIERHVAIKLNARRHASRTPVALLVTSPYPKCRVSKVFTSSCCVVAMILLFRLQKLVVHVYKYSMNASRANKYLGQVNTMRKGGIQKL
jgi:hypothetical protein